MKILVDEMPKNTEECPYSEIHGNAKGDTWFGCRYSGITACSDVSKCPYFTSYNYKNKISVGNGRDYEVVQE